MRAMKSTENKNWFQNPDITLPEAENNFHSPSKEFAPQAFWFWDTTLDRDHIVRQVNAMSAQGMSPGYLQDRGTKRYLSDEWFSTVRSAVDAAKENDMPIGFCDEVGAPCGVVDYRLPGERPYLTAKSLKWDKIDVPANSIVSVPECFFCVAARRDAQSGLLSSDDLSLASGTEFTATGSDFTLYCFSFYTDHTHGGSTVNYLDHRLGDALEEMVYEPYQKALGDDLGEAVHCVFLDMEGDYGYKLAWSDDLAAEYEKQTGRDIRLWMPLLIEEDVQGLWGKARWDWYHAVSEVYCNGFIRRTTDWFEKRGALTTCHTWEDNLYAQALLVSDFFKSSRAVSIPGIDSLVLSTLNCRIFRETQSVAEMEGRRFMCEMLAAVGWSITPAIFKQTANAAITWGVNHFVLHGVSTQTAFERISFPPDFYEWNPYWPHFHRYTEFVKRASYISSLGKLVPSAVIVNPMDSAWALLGDTAFDEKEPFHFYVIEQHKRELVKYGEKVAAIDAAYTAAMQTLTRARIEYMIADGCYMQAMQQDENGRFTLNGSVIETLILPPMVLLPTQTMQAILSFAHAGGRVYCLGELPSGSSEKGMNDPAMQEMARELGSLPNVIWAENGLDPFIAAGEITSTAKFENGAFEMLQQHRKIDGQDVYWLANNTGEVHECTLLFKGAKGSAEIWDCETGKIRPVYSEETDDGLLVSLTFNQYEGFWLALRKERIEVSRPAPRRVLSTLDGIWRMSVPMDAQLTFDPARTLILPQEVLDNGITDTLKPWSEWNITNFSGAMDYEADFTLDTVDPGLEIDLGQVNFTAGVWINGVHAGDCFWAPHRLSIAEFCHPGVNHIRIRVCNLIVNATKQYSEYEHVWIFGKMTDEVLTSGLIGPVQLLLKV